MMTTKLRRAEARLEGARALLHEREARGLRLPLYFRIVLFSLTLPIFFSELAPMAVRLLMAPVIVAILLVNAYGLRLTARGEKLQRVGYAGVALDVLLMTLMPLNFYFIDLGEGYAPALVMKIHYPVVCALLIAVNAVATRPAYPLIATLGALANHLGMLALSFGHELSPWTTSMQVAMTTGALGGPAVGLTIASLAALGAALTYFNRAVRAAVIDAAELEAAQALEREKQTQAVMDAKLGAVVELVAGVSHEVNTPLGSVRSGLATQRKAVEKLRQLNEAGSPDKRERLLEVLHSSAAGNEEALERIARVVENLEAFARVDEAELKNADVRELLSTALSLVSQQSRRGVEARCDFDEVPELACHPAALSQAFLTLLSNAFEAVDGDGNVVVKVTAPDDTVVIEIADDGRGIDADRLSHLFDVQFAQEGGRVRVGFGLPICRNVVQLHEGTIEVDSELGRGTRFVITLPRHPT